MVESTTIGPMVLAGSGEYTPTMDIVDKMLLTRTKGPVLLIATACAEEGEDRMSWWEQMGVGHFCRLGAEAQPLHIVNQADADATEAAERIAAASLIWFCGGNAAYLAQVFKGTASFRALEEANRKGAIVAGGGGGMAVLSADAGIAFGAAPGSPARGLVESTGPTGLGLATPIVALAQLARTESRQPGLLESAASHLQPGQMIVGIDEETAVVWLDGAWQVFGRKRAVVLAQDGQRVIFQHGDRIDTLQPPERAS
jgi:cyanophycinase-like exopeptidase